MKKTLAIFSPKAPWIDSEGQSRVVKEQVLRLKKDFNIEIFCCNPNTKTKINKVFWEGIKVYEFSAITNAYLFSFDLYKFLKDKEYDIIHSHGFTTFLPLAGLIPKAKKRFFQTHYHPIASNWIFELFRLFYDPTIGKLLINRYNKIFCVSDFEKKSLIKKFKIRAKKTILIYNGVFPRKGKVIKGNKPYLIYVGRFEKYKNIQVIIKAMPFLKNYDLKIIGRGPYEKNLKKIISKADLEGQVEILTNVSDSKLAGYLQGAKFLINFSKVEAFGLTILEALLAGTKAIVNDSTALSEFTKIYPKSVFKINIKHTSYPNIAKIIKKIKTGKTKENLSRFKWENIVKKIKKEYEK